MASKRKRGEVWEYTVKRAGVLDKPVYLTFRDEAEGDAYCRNLEALLDKGIVPSEHAPQTRVSTIADLVRDYERDAHPSLKDRGALGPLLSGRGTTPLLAINARWVDVWISEMKRVERLAPATIRARVGALARAADWGVRKGLLQLPDNPLRTLSDGYAQYTELDAALAKVRRLDVERDRRLEPGEYERILGAINVGVLTRKQRPLHLPNPRAMRALFVLAVESAMRLREMYTLTLDQVNLAKRTVFLEKTKNGDKRQVPLSSVAQAELKDYIKTIGDAPRLFPWWSGDESPKVLGGTSDYLSKLYAGVFEQAGAKGLRFHDLRHEAVSRLFERTKLSETAIMRISGHKSHRMLLRYSNLRGSDLADALW